MALQNIALSLRSTESFMKRYSSFLALFAGFALTAGCIQAQSNDQRLELDRKGETIVLEPYAPNVLRVTLSLQHDPALAKPGYGFVASSDASGWAASQTEKADIYESSRIVATVDRPNPLARPRLQTQADIRKYFNGSTPGAHITFERSSWK
jgi:alpha-D-xyloside xylohydrolase